MAKKSKAKAKKSKKAVKRVKAAAPPPPPKVIVYNLRPGGQPGHRPDDQSATVVTFSTWRCDGVASPDVNVNAGSVPYELGDDMVAVKRKVADAVAALHSVEKADVLFLT